MASTNPARGMRDFLPADVRKRNYVINIIKEVYESYGFEPLETPAVENIDTLLGKYGDEGNQLIFRIMKRGDKLDAGLKALRETGIMSGQVLAETVTPEGRFSDLGLRYDLTVPLARVVADRRNELPKFFKRYQIQPVWRADRPARGRFREFYQCDVDCIGSGSMIVEAELVSAVCEILTKLGFEDFLIRINHREVIQGMLETAGVPLEQHGDAIVALDKIDKIGREGVFREFVSRGISDAVGNRLMAYFDFFIKSRSSEIFDDIQKRRLVNLLSNVKEYEAIAEKVGKYLNDLTGRDTSENLNYSREHINQYRNLGVLCTLGLEIQAGASKGFGDLAEILRLLWDDFSGAKIVFDPTLARGLSYYTGTIMEINVPDLAGSLGGGGRYDGLIGMFGKEQIPACGFSLGLERILVVMEERGMFPPEIAESTPADVMVTIGSEETISDSLKLASELRASGLRVTVYPQPDKEDKQWKYANSIGVPWLCSVNEADVAEKMVSFQDLKTRERYRESLNDAAVRMRGE